MSGNTAYPGGFFFVCVLLGMGAVGVRLDLTVHATMLLCVSSCIEWVPHEYTLGGFSMGTKDNGRVVLFFVCGVLWAVLWGVFLGG